MKNVDMIVFTGGGGVLNSSQKKGLRLPRHW